MIREKYEQSNIPYCMSYTNIDTISLRKQFSLLNKMISEGNTKNPQIYWQILNSLLTFYKSMNSTWSLKDETKLYVNEKFTYII